MGNNNINKLYVIITSILLVIIAVVLAYYIKTSSKQYLVQKGEIENSEIVNGFVVKDEVTISKDQSKILVPVISENTRVSKGDIIATYKGEEYKNYEQTLNEMDKEILELMKDLPAVYSSEADTIEGYINSLIKSSEQETSYNKMQEYKQKINSYISRRANIIGSLSPTGAKVKSLIQKRNDYEERAKKSNDNIIASKGGIVLYSADGLENNLKSKNIDKYTYDNIEKVIKENKVKDNTKIKIVNNYEAYIVIRADIKNLKYMVEGFNYKLRLIENNNIEIDTTLYKYINQEEYVDVYFKVTNQIEELVNIRDSEFEVVWDSYEGLMIPVEAITSKDNISYVTIIRYSEYIEIPVKIRIQNDGFAIVRNYNEEELEELNIESEYDLKLFDRIVIKK